MLICTLSACLHFSPRFLGPGTMFMFCFVSFHHLGLPLLDIIEKSFDSMVSDQQGLSYIMDVLRDILYKGGPVETVQRCTVERTELPAPPISDEAGPVQGDEDFHWLTTFPGSA